MAAAVHGRSSPLDQPVGVVVVPPNAGNHPVECEGQPLVLPVVAGGRHRRHRARKLTCAVEVAQLQEKVEPALACSQKEAVVSAHERQRVELAGDGEPFVELVGAVQRPEAMEEDLGQRGRTADGPGRGQCLVAECPAFPSGQGPVLALRQSSGNERGLDRLRVEGAECGPQEAAAVRVGVGAGRQHAAVAQPGPGQEVGAPQLLGQVGRFPARGLAGVHVATPVLGGGDGEQDLATFGRVTSLGMAPQRGGGSRPPGGTASRGR